MSSDVSSAILTKRRHFIPMMSQDKVTQPKEFIKWAKKRNYKTFLVQFKLNHPIRIDINFTKLGDTSLLYFLAPRALVNEDENDEELDDF